MHAPSTGYVWMQLVSLRDLLPWAEGDDKASVQARIDVAQACIDDGVNATAAPDKGSAMEQEVLEC